MRFGILAGVAALALSAPALASGPFDGSEPLLCSADDTVECSDSGTCLPGDAEDVGLPALIRIDAKKKQIRGLSGPRAGVTTPITSVHNQHGRLIIHGGQGGRGFSIVVDTDGQATMSVSDSGLAFIVFGECTTQ